MASNFWNGTVLALRTQGLDGNPPRYDDMTVADLRDVVDYFRTYGDNEVAHPSWRPAQKVKGVRINCEGDQKVFGVGKYVAVEVPREHFIFADAATPPSISTGIELPVLARKYPLNEAWVYTRGGPDNQAATFLHLNANPNSRKLLGLGLASNEMAK